jgi:hypothetical protein
VYNKPKTTRSDLARQMEDLRIQAKLQNKLEALLNKEMPTKPAEKVARNAQIDALRKQIIDFRSEQRAAEREIKEAQKASERQQRADQREADRQQRAAEREAEKQANKRTPEQIALDAIKKRTKKEIAELQERINKGDYAAPEKREPIKLDAEAKELKDELVKLKQERQKRLNAQELARYGWFKKDGAVTREGILKGKASQLLTEIMNVPRSLMASMDFSAPLRQAVVATTAHPILASKAFVEMFRQAVSQKRYDRWLNDLYSSDIYPMMKESGLYIADANNHELNAKEERFMSNIAERIPVIGTIGVKGSQRAYTAYLNKMRVDMFLQATDAFIRDGKTMENNPELYKAWADFTNAATGRGSLGKFEEAGAVLNNVFFSPRLIASRISLLKDIISFGGINVPKEIRVRKMRDLLSFIGVGLSAVSLVSLATGVFGDEDDDIFVEQDARSSDFGKIRVGNTRFDVWGGFQQYIRVATQLSTQQVKATSGKVYDLDKDKFPFKGGGDVAWSFIQGKFAPVPALAFNVINGGKNMIGEDVTWKSALWNNLVPLTAQDAVDAYQDGGVGRVFMVVPAATFGIGASTYLPREKK